VFVPPEAGVFSALDNGILKLRAGERIKVVGVAPPTRFWARQLFIFIAGS